MEAAIQKNDKKTIHGWAMYDWANSVYSLTISTAVFPSYYFGVTGGKGQEVDFFGVTIGNSVLYTFTLSFAFLLVAVMNPVLSSIADTKGNKLTFMKAFCYLGSISCIALFFFEDYNLEFGIISFSLAAIGFAGSIVFYNAFLPEIATEDLYDKISAKGFSLGYIGSVILLVANLVMITFHEAIGIEESMAARISFLSVGLWWMGFAQITFNRLPNNIFHKEEVKENVFSKSIKELKKVWAESKRLPLLRRFLLAFFLYNMGVQTVMYMATIFGEEVVGMEMSELIILVLILQLVAIAGAYVFAKISEKKGNVFSLCITLLIWIGICVTAYFITEGMTIEFYILGAFVGVVMGGVQSLSRSTYSKLMPVDTTDHASYFSFYEVLEKSSTATGTFVYGMILSLTGTQNNSTFALAGFFVLGFLILRTIPSKTIYNTKLEG